MSMLVSGPVLCHMGAVRHESDSQGFTEAALLGSSEARLGVVLQKSQ